LECGEKADYLPLTQREFDDENWVQRPWTKDQVSFVESNKPIRIVVGRPGSGKTTVLWRAIEARAGQKVLYLTWSRELTRYASEHLNSFAPQDVDIVARDFRTFLGELCGSDVTRQPLSESISQFKRSIQHLEPTVLGPWADRPESLFAEVRAHLLGRAIFAQSEEGSAAPLVQSVNCDVYLAERSKREAIGEVAAKSVLRAFDKVKDSVTFLGSFPELVGAAEALKELWRTGLPDGLLDIDRVVVDEVQDLTYLEASIVVELCRVIAQHKGHAPCLLIAGDDGQTVRPSGFEWGRLNELIGRRVGKPEKFYLDENLRCPTRIARVVDRVSEKYRSLSKCRRPKKQRSEPGGQHVEAYLLYAQARAEEGSRLLEDFEDIENVIVLSSESTLPTWVPEHLRDTVMTPADAKGLEYQSVCVLDPGSLLTRVEAALRDDETAALEENELRTSVDQLRVALSRATETLAFIDVNGGDAERDMSIQLLEDPALFDPEDLLEHFTDVDRSSEERVVMRIVDARALLDERPRRAWRRAYQGVRLLGDPTLPNGVATDSVRQEAHEALLTVAARLLVEGIPKGIEKSEITEAAEASLGYREVLADTTAFRELAKWVQEKSEQVFGLLEAVAALSAQSAWLMPALTSHIQMMRQSIDKGARDRRLAAAFDGDVEGWLRSTMHLGDIPSEARKLRCTAFDVLVQPNSEAAEKVLRKITPEDVFRLGQLREAQGRPAEAAKAFEEVNAGADALRNWRAAGDWEKAVLLAEGEARRDLEWMIEHEQLYGRRPEGQRDRMTKAERERLMSKVDLK